MPERLPEHWKIVAIRVESDDMSDADSLRIAALESVRDVQRESPAFTPAAQQGLIPAARSQLVPDESGDAE